MCSLVIWSNDARFYHTSTTTTTTTTTTHYYQLQLFYMKRNGTTISNHFIFLFSHFPFFPREQDKLGRATFERWIHTYKLHERARFTSFESSRILFLFLLLEKIQIVDLVITSSCAISTTGIFLLFLFSFHSVSTSPPPPP